nr:MAG TPA: hypothetical protein [Caudoviricetes sp.]
MKRKYKRRGLLSGALRHFWQLSHLFDRHT